MSFVWCSCDSVVTAHPTIHAGASMATTRLTVIGKSRESIRSSRVTAVTSKFNAGIRKPKMTARNITFLANHPSSLFLMLITESDTINAMDIEKKKEHSIGGSLRSLQPSIMPDTDVIMNKELTRNRRCCVFDQYTRRTIVW